MFVLKSIVSVLHNDA